MNTPTPLRWRRRSVIGATAAISLMSVMPAMSIATAAAASRGSCPAAESLVPGTTWHKHTLAPGVVLTEGSKKDSRGLVKMHVLRVNTTAKGVSFSPLLHSLASRSPLSRLAAGRKHLVAAVNTGYFDFFTGAPLQPVISKHAALTLAAKHQAVVGVGTNGAWESGKVWLAAAVYAGSKSYQVRALNEDWLPTGISVYNSKWGSKGIPTRNSTTVRPVVNNKLGAAHSNGNGFLGTKVPSAGYLLVAHGSKAQSWLKSFATGTTVGVAGAVRTDAPRPFVQAYGVGVQVVKHAGVAITGFTCNSANTKQPARTAIGFANGGKTLIIAEAEEHPGTSLHGLDNDQMSKLMVQLGASHAFEWDGSGSTELLARMPHSSSLSRRTYPADGVERPMPLGMGIFSKRVG